MRLNYQVLYQDLQEKIIELLTSDVQEKVNLGNAMKNVLEQLKAKQQRPVFSDEY